MTEDGEQIFLSSVVRCLSSDIGFRRRDASTATRLAEHDGLTSGISIAKNRCESP